MTDRTVRSSSASSSPTGSSAASASACAPRSSATTAGHGPAAVRLRAGQPRRPGVLRTDTGIPITVEHGLDRLARSDIISITAWELFDRVPVAGAARRVPGRARPRRHDRQPLHGRVRPRRGRAARRPAGDDPLEVRRRARRPVPRRRRSTRRCSTSTTGRSSPARGRRPASTPCCTWCAASGAPPRPTRWPARWSCPPHRDGGQAQFIDAPVPACQDDLLGAVLEWAQRAPRRGHQRGDRWPAGR